MPGFNPIACEYCGKPTHLEAVTHAENIRRGWALIPKKTHCPRGHPYDEENTHWYKNRLHCRACNIIACTAYQKRRKEQIQ